MLGALKIHHYGPIMGLSAYQTMEVFVRALAIHKLSNRICTMVANFDYSLNYMIFMLILVKIRSKFPLFSLNGHCFFMRV